MNEQTRTFLRELLAEAGVFLGPLILESRRPRQLYRTIGTMGWNLEGLLELAPNDLATALEVAEPYFSAIASAADQNDPQTVIDQAFTNLELALDNLDDFRQLLLQASATNPGQDIAQAFAEDLWQLLLLMYLLDHAPQLFHLAVLLGLIRERRAAPIYLIDQNDGRLLRFPILRPTLSVDNLALTAVDSLGGLLREWLRQPPESPEAFLHQVSAPLLGHVRALAVALGSARLEGFEVDLSPSAATLRSKALPSPAGGSGPLALNLSLDYSPSLTIKPETWELAWQTPGTSDGGPALTLFQLLGLEISLTGDSADNCPTSLSLALLDERLRCTLRGGVGVAIPLETITDQAGDQISARVCANLSVAVDGEAKFQLDTLEHTGSFKLGGSNGLGVASGQLTLKDLQLPLATTDDPPFALAVTGKLALGENQVQIAARYERDAFELSSKAELILGNGIRLEPLAPDQPVLRLRLALDGAGTHHCQIAGRIAIPTDSGVVTVAVEGTLTVSQDGDQLRIDSCQISSNASLHALDLTEQVRLRRVGVTIGYAQGGFSLTLSGAMSLFKLGQDSAADDGYALVVENFKAALGLAEDRVELQLKQGTLQLPNPLFSNDSGQPTVELDDNNPLTIVYDPQAAQALTVNGAVLFGNFQVSLPSADPGLTPTAILQNAKLEFPPGASPILTDVQGSLSVPIPTTDTTLSIQLSGIDWRLDGLPDKGTIALAEDVLIPLGGEVNLVLRGAPQPDQPGMSLEIQRLDAGATRFRFSGAVAIEMPTSLLSRDASDPEHGGNGALFLEASGSLSLTTQAGDTPTIHDMAFTVGGTFRLGDPQQGMLIKDANLTARHIEQLFQSSGKNFSLELIGRLELAEFGTGLSLQEARFSFADLSQLPKFSLAGLGFDVDANKLADLPIVITEPTQIVFQNPDLPLPTLLAADNIVITLSLALELPLGQASGWRGPTGYRPSWWTAFLRSSSTPSDSASATSP